MNYFELFEIPVAPKVDNSTLVKKYFELQRKNHPDFFSDASDSEKEVSIQLSADINKAYATFKDEQKTLEYFLKLKGVITEEEKYDLPADFLMEMMDLNEEFSEMNRDEISSKIQEYEQSLYKIINDFIEFYDTKKDDKALPALKSYFYKKKYLKRILDRLED